MFAEDVDRERKNPRDIKHIRADDHGPCRDQLPTEGESRDTRNDVASLVLLPAD